MKNISIGTRIKGWDFVTDKNLDPAGIDLLHGEKLPYPDNSVDNIYICGILEHIYDSSTIELLRECYRIMRRRSMLRISAINTTLYHHAYMRGDREMFYDFCDNNNFSLKIGKYHKAPTDQLFLFTFASQLSSLCGGDFKVNHDGKEFTDFNMLLDEVGINTCLNLVLQQNIDLEKHREAPGAINWLSIGKLHQFLLQEISPENKKGFPLVYISGYGQSSCPLMRDKAFDCQYPQGSLYIEAMR